jgi:spore germination protein KA
MVLSLPYLFIENFQANDDYYLGPWFSTLGRLLRMLSFLISACMPALYIATVCYQNEMIPGTLLFNIAKATSSIPFTSVTEAVIMLIIFEILREAGARMPTKLGQALSIVGALILGQAAVESGIVSNAMVIVVAMSGITSLMVPRLKEATVLLRFLYLGAAAVLGLYGLFFSLLATFLHLVSLSSFGVFFLEGFDATRGRYMRDIFWRAPVWMMRLRPSFSKDRVRREKKR